MDGNSATPERAGETYLEGFARRLRQARSIVSNSQAAVARSVGVSPVQWFRYENALHEMKLETLAAFCVIHRICPRWLLLGELGDTMDGPRRELLLLRYPDNPEFRGRRETAGQPRPPRLRTRAEPAAAE